MSEATGDLPSLNIEFQEHVAAAESSRKRRDSLKNMDNILSLDLPSLEKDAIPEASNIALNEAPVLQATQPVSVVEKQQDSSPPTSFASLDPAAAQKTVIESLPPAIAPVAPDALNRRIEELEQQIFAQAAELQATRQNLDGQKALAAYWELQANAYNEELNAVKQDAETYHYRTFGPPEIPYCRATRVCSAAKRT